MTSGGSNRLGNDAVSARHLELPSMEEIHIPLERIVSFEERELSPLDIPLSIDKTLPVRPWGNGIYRGDGSGLGLGHGDGVGNGSGERTVSGRSGVGILKLLHSVSPDYALDTGDAPVDGQKVMVRILVGADGIPMNAKAVSGWGKKGSFPAILQAAMRWRFKVPKDSEALAPFEVIVKFTYDENSSEMRTINKKQVHSRTIEIKSVEIR